MKTKFIFLSVTFLSYFGTGIQLIVSSYLAYSLTDSIKAVGILLVLVTVTEAVFNYLSGRFSDRLSRTHICMAGFIIRAFASLMIPIALLRDSQEIILVIFVANFITALGDAIFVPANNALSLELSGKVDRRSFSAQFERVIQLGMLLSASVGMLLADWVGVAYILIANIGIYAFGAMAILKVQENRGKTYAKEQENTEATSFLSFVRNAPTSVMVPDKFGLGILFGQYHVIVVVSNILIVPAILSLPDGTLTKLGFAEALASIGIVTGTFLFKWLSERFKIIKLCIISYLACTGILCLIPFGNYPWIASMVLLNACAFGLARVSVRKKVYEHLENQEAGTFFGFFNALGLIVGALISLGVSWIADSSGIGNGYFVLFISITFASCLGYQLVRQGPDKRLQRKPA